MLDSKSQAALEFLMSYGWAILVVLIAVGALAYFGVLNVDKFLPEKCTLTPGFACLDFKAGTDGITLVIKNAMGGDIVIETIALTKYGCESTFFKRLNNGQQYPFDVSCNLSTAGSKLNSDIRFLYESPDSLVHNASGRLITRIEPNSIAIGEGQSNLQICQNAQNNGLCNGLDILYGQGYQAACCSEHNLCC